MKKINWNDKQNQQLIKCLLAIKTKTQMQNLLKDLCTPGEIQDFAKRIECAILILQGHNYRDISKKLQLSTTTVTRVAKWAKQNNNILLR